MKASRGAHGRNVNHLHRDTKKIGCYSALTPWWAVFVRLRDSSSGVQVAVKR